MVYWNKTLLATTCLCTQRSPSRRITFPYQTLKIWASTANPSIHPSTHPSSFHPASQSWRYDTALKYSRVSFSGSSMMTSTSVKPPPCRVGGEKREEKITDRTRSEAFVRDKLERTLWVKENPQIQFSHFVFGIMQSDLHSDNLTFVFQRWVAGTTNTVFNMYVRIHFVFKSVDLDYIFLLLNCDKTDCELRVCNSVIINLIKPYIFDNKVVKKLSNQVTEPSFNKLFA